MMCRLGFLLVFCLGTFCAGGEVDETFWTLGEKSHALLKGDSTVRKWSVATEAVHGSIHLPFSPDQVSDFLRWTREHPEAAQSKIEKHLKLDPPRIEAVLKIKVKELKSGNERMEKDMQDALKAEEYPWIIFTLSEVEKVSVHKSADGKEPGFILHTAGVLKLAGEQKNVALDFELVPSSEQGLLLVSNSTFLMTSFNITPPRALFGLLKAHDKVDIEYQIQLVEKTSTPSNSSDSIIKDAR